MQKQRGSARGKQRRRQKKSLLRTRDVGDVAVRSIPFKQSGTFSYSAATTTNSIALQINSTFFSSSTRVYDLAVGYTEFRFTKLAVTVYPFVDSTTSDNVFAMAYTPEADSSATVINYTWAILGQINCSAMVPAQKTVPTTLSIGRDILLATPQKWWPTNAASPTINAALQGTIIFIPRASSTCTLVFRVSGILELCVSNDSLTVARLLRPVVEKEDEEVLTDHEDFKIIKRFKDSARIKERK